MRFSIIINNYNYEQFVGQAIESALAVNWPDKEILVVDDGSTDASRAVIEAFRDRIIRVFTKNSGQTRAINSGFARSTGDAVILLDADDLLLPSVAIEVAAVWHPRVARVQYCMIYVDQKLRSLGRIWPIYAERHTPEYVSRSMSRTGNYLSSPMSGNAWNRDFLKEVFPLPNLDESTRGADLYLHKLAPFFGDVISLRSPQCLYRRHRANWSASASTEGRLRRVATLMRQEETAQRLGNQLLRCKNIANSIGNENEYYHKLRLICRQFELDGAPEINTPAVLIKYWQSIAKGEVTLRKKLALLVWSLLVVATPRSVAARVAVVREDHDAAPLNTKGITRLATRLRSMTS